MIPNRVRARFRAGVRVRVRLRLRLRLSVRTRVRVEVRPRVRVRRSRLGPGCGPNCLAKQIRKCAARGKLIPQMYCRSIGIVFSHDPIFGVESVRLCVTRRVRVPTPCGPWHSELELVARLLPCEVSEMDVTRAV